MRTSMTAPHTMGHCGTVVGTPSLLLFQFPILAISAILAISFATLCLRPSARPPPGGRRFVANKRRSAIRKPYDSLVEALFPAGFAVDLADY
jgi:hypothetical protein